MLIGRLGVWAPWLDHYNGPGWNKGGYMEAEVPVEIALSVIAKESRASSSALGCAGEVGLFQIVAGDAASLKLPEGCASREIPNFPENPPASVLYQGHNNIQYGLEKLDELYGQEASSYMTERDIADDGLGWYGIRGRIATAMFQCGHRGLRNEICHSKGGFTYAEEVFTCWIPFMRENVEEIR